MLLSPWVCGEKHTPGDTREAFSSCSPLGFPNLLSQPQGSKPLGTVRTSQSRSRAPGLVRMLPRTAQGETGPPPLSSAVETKPSLVRLGGLKHVLGKSGPENRVRLALHLTLRDLQKLRQGPGSSVPYASPYWDVQGLGASRRPHVKSI